MTRYMRGVEIVRGRIRAPQVADRLAVYAPREERERRENIRALVASIFAEARRLRR